MARYAAEKRNFYWQHERTATGNPDIVLAENVSPYPRKLDRISDHATEDGGGNFGRIARYGLMNTYIEEMNTLEIRGISAKEWLTFFKKSTKPED